MRLPNWVGDIVMATPALAALRNHWPDARLVAAGPAAAVPLLDGLGCVDAVLPLPSRRHEGAGAVRRAAALLRAGRFDLAVLLTNSFSTAVVARLAGIPARAGYALNGRGWLLTHHLEHPREAGRHRMPTPMVEYYSRLLETIGVPRGSHRFQLATASANDEAAAAWLARAGLDKGRPLVAIHAGASFGPSKLWLPERFAAVADTLRDRHGVGVILFCGPGEEPLVRSIAAACRGPVASAAEDLVDLSVLKALVRRLALLITTDTGPRHLAPAFDVPVVCLMGATDPRFTNTNLHDTLIERSNVECSPCQLKTCPIDHRCMTRLGTEQVLAAATRLLVRRGVVPEPVT